MTAAQNKQLTRQIIEEVLTTGNVDPMRKHPGLHEVIPTIERITQTLSDRSVSFPVEIAEGEWVAKRAVFRGTHTGNGFGTEPTGKTIEYEVLIFSRVVDGVIVQQHSQADAASIMEQIGAALPGTPE